VAQALLEIREDVQVIAALRLGELADESVLARRGFGERQCEA
jgi:hypothetical protein